MLVINLDFEKIQQLAMDWVHNKSNCPPEYYCETRDIFEAHNDKLLEPLKQCLNEDIAYFTYAILGELGNNSFDHNIGQWPNIPGIFFSCECSNGSLIAIVADRGVGVLTTLRRALPELQNDQDAILAAFTKRISGRIGEKRGNGLKFVKENIENNHFLFEFLSGSAKISINAKTEITEMNNNVNGCLSILKYNL